MNPNGQTKSSVIELTTDVNSTVEQLKELGARLRSDGEPLGPGDLTHIDEVIAALKELDAKRHKAHEHLETETIKASVLRHRLANFPHKLKAEVNAVISSARDTNAAEMHQLQSQLTRINDEACQSEKRQQVLELYNQRLEPEQASLKTQHADMVKKLNACMGKKAKMQIRLNETCDKLSNTNAQIDSLEAGMKKLDQDMLVAREEFTQERDRLTEHTNDTKTKSGERKTANLELKKQLEKSQSDVVDTGLIVSDKQKALHDIEVQIRRLMALEDELKRKLVTGADKTKSLEESCTTTEQETVQMRQEYATKKAEMLEKTKLFKKEVELAAVETKSLSGVKKGLRRDHKHAQEGSGMQARALRDMQENVNGSKRTLIYQAEEGARLEAENKDLAFRIVQLKESHTVNVQLLKDDITETKALIDKEKKTRQTVEELYNTLQAQIATHRTQHTDAMTSMVTGTEDSDNLYLEMCDKAAQLQDEVKGLDASITSLTQQLKSACSKLHNTRTSLTEEVETLEQNIAEMNEEITDRNDTLGEIEPVCESLEKDFEDKDTMYESRKRDIIALKSKRSELDDDIKRTERELERIHLPQEQLRLDSLRCRAYTRQVLRERVIEVEGIENKVVEARQKLAAITNENRRIEQASNSLRKEITNLRVVFDSGKHIEEQLDEALGMYRRDLSEQWKENDKLEECASTRDRVMLKDLNALKKASEERLETITTIHDNFEQELQSFTGYVNTAAQVVSKHHAKTHKQKQ